MELYVLVKDVDGQPKFVKGGGSSTRPSIKVYDNEKRARVYAKRYNATAIKLRVEDGEQLDI